MAGEVHDDPNRQSLGLDPAWVEGTGGSAAEPPAEPTAATTASGSPDLDEMTKDELLAHAKQLGASPANNAMSKDELRASIEAHQEG